VRGADRKTPPPAAKLVRAAEVPDQAGSRVEPGQAGEAALGCQQVQAKLAASGLAGRKDSSPGTKGRPARPRTQMAWREADPHGRTRPRTTGSLGRLVMLGSQRARSGRETQQLRGAGECHHEDHPRASRLRSPNR